MSADRVAYSAKDLGVFTLLTCMQNTPKEQETKRGREWHAMRMHSDPHQILIGGMTSFAWNQKKRTCDVQFSQAGVSCCEVLATIRRAAGSNEWTLTTDEIMGEYGLLTVNDNPPPKSVIFNGEYQVEINSGDFIKIMGNTFQFMVRRPWDPEFEDMPRPAFVSEGVQPAWESGTGKRKQPECEL